MPRQRRFADPRFPLPSRERAEVHGPVGTSGRWIEWARCGPNADRHAAHAGLPRVGVEIVAGAEQTGDAAADGADIAVVVVAGAAEGEAHRDRADAEAVVDVGQGHDPAVRGLDLDLRSP